MKKYLLLFLLVAGYGLSGQAQKSETLTNQFVIDLFKAGLSKETIVAKIRSSACQFDMSTASLINLKKQKLPDEVLNAMVEKDAGEGSNASNNKNTTPSKSNGKDAAKSNAKESVTSGEKSTGLTPTATADLDFINVPHFYNKAKKSLAVLERSTVAVKAKVGLGSMFGGSTPIVFKMDSARSPVRLPEQESVSFMINTGNNVPEIFGLYRMKADKKKREATWFNVSAFENKSDKDVVAFNYKKVKDGVYEIVPVSKLEKGEYCFVNKASYGTYGGAKADVFAFGVGE